MYAELKYFFENILINVQKIKLILYKIIFIISHNIYYLLFYICKKLNL